MEWEWMKVRQRDKPTRQNLLVLLFYKRWASNIRKTIVCSEIATECVKELKLNNNNRKNNEEKIENQNVVKCPHKHQIQAENEFIV